ncbi:hypothetical protein LTR84_007102 [Exophiala bonariae]|uniref:DUF7066 domain-containing protein n=1 Tax=Exophiala bonariae TaxID=1690606 RepID=A0AAV9N327_9EURO|nr:hypothetical protein LTR84_007102 [Exophiala bonariae]
MAINWRLRESVFRLLAAVYAELGEAAVSSSEKHELCPLAELINAQFKGRYASIAKFFGDDATYDAVKSFFAKEIAKAADDLGRQNPGAQRTQRPVAQKSSSSRQSRRTMHLDFNDQDISFVSEREVEAHSRHALQRPPKRPRLYESPLPVEHEESSLPESQVLPQLSPDGLPNGANHGFRAVNGQPPSPLLQMNGHATREARDPSIQHEFPIPPGPRELTSDSTDPSYIPSPSPPLQKPTRSKAAPRKRPYKEVPEYDLEYQTVSSSSQTGSRHTQEPGSFGYVSNAGFFRCALCFSQLSSQDALDKHEALSKLHLRNLQNPEIVSKGRAKLAQVIALPYQSSASPGAFRPLRVGGFGERGEPSTNGHFADSVPTRSDVTKNLYQPQRRQENMANSSRAIDTIEVHPRTASAPPSHISLSTSHYTASRAPDMEPVEETSIGKGKQRASPYPAAAIQTYQTAPTRPTSQAPGPAPINEEPFKRPNGMNDPPNETDTNAGRAEPTKPRNTKPPSRLRPLEVAEILRLTGIRLAEKYISEHPDLIAQTMGRVQREFTAASASATASVGPSSVEMQPPARVRQKDVEMAGSRVRNGGRDVDVDVVVLD